MKTKFKRKTFEIEIFCNIKIVFIVFWSIECVLTE